MYDITYQANALIEQAGRFDSIHKSDIYYLVVEKLRPKLKNSLIYDEDFKPIIITTKEIQERTGVDNAHLSQYMNRLREAIEGVQIDGTTKTIGLLDQKVKVSLPDKDIICNWFSKAIYTKDYIKVEFNKDLKPLLLELSEIRYSRVPQKALLKLRTEYGRKMLELICLFPTNGYDGKLTKTGFVDKPEIRKEYLRNFLGVKEGELTRVSDFKINVLDKAIADINALTEETGFYIYDITPQKIGRRIVAYNIRAKVPKEVYDTSSINKGIPDDAKHIETENVNLFELSKEDYIIWLLKKCAVSTAMAQRISKQYRLDRVDRNVSYVKVLCEKKGKVLQPGMIVAAIQSDYATQYSLGTSFTPAIIDTRDKASQEGKYAPKEGVNQ